MMLLPTQNRRTSTLTLWSTFFGKVQLAGLNLHVHKATLIAESINFCGRIVSKNGVQFALRTLDALQEMPPPATWLGVSGCHKLDKSQHSGVCGARGSFAEVTSIDHQQGRCNQASHSKSQAGLTLGRGAPSCLHRYANQLRNLAVMAYPNPEKVLCVSADASDEFYGGMITQIENADLELSVDHQRHKPLAFCSGVFKGAQQRWGTSEKEGFALI
jgi:hypothetical protein